MVDTVTIGGKEHTIINTYRVARYYQEQYPAEKWKAASVLDSQDYALDILMKILAPNPFNTVDELMDTITYPELSELQTRIGEILFGIKLEKKEEDQEQGEPGKS